MSHQVPRRGGSETTAKESADLNRSDERNQQSEAEQGDQEIRESPPGASLIRRRRRQPPNSSTTHSQTQSRKREPIHTNQNGDRSRIKQPQHHERRTAEEIRRETGHQLRRGKESPKPQKGRQSPSGAARETASSPLTFKIYILKGWIWIVEGEGAVEFVCCL